MQGAFLLDVIVRKGATILELLARENESLLIWRDALFVLDLGLHIVYRIACFDVQGDGFASQCLDEDLHASAKAQDQMQGAFLLDVIVRKGATILELLARENEALLIWRDALFVLDLGLHIVYRIAGLDVQGDGFACQRLDEDLHASAKAQLEDGRTLSDY